jgi:protein-tyrosine-phosphatase
VTTQWSQRSAPVASTSAPSAADRLGQVRVTATEGSRLRPDRHAARPHAGKKAQPLPLFLCHANCCRSVLASYLYPHLCSGAPASSAGLGPDQQTSDRALAMLAYWGIDAAGHRPTKLDRRLCDKTTAIFVMAPPYLRRLLLESGADLASKAYLYADPFASPRSLGPGQFTVPDPSFDERPAPELVEEFTWMRDQALQIRQALLGRGRPLIPAARYLNLLQSVDPTGH